MQEKEDVNTAPLYVRPQAEKAAMLGKSHGADCLSSGRVIRMYFGGFCLNLFEEISRVMLGNRFPSQRFIHVGSSEASGCSTDTHYVGKGLLRNKV